MKSLFFLILTASTLTFANPPASETAEDRSDYREFVPKINLGLMGIYAGQQQEKASQEAEEEVQYHMSLGAAGKPCAKPSALVGNDCRDKKEVMNKLDKEAIVFQNPSGKLVEVPYGSAYGACGGLGGYLAHRIEEGGSIKLKYYNDFTDKRSFGPKQNYDQTDLKDINDFWSRFHGDEIAQITGQVKIHDANKALVAKKGIHFCVTKETMKSFNSAASTVDSFRAVKGSLMGAEGFEIHSGQQ